MPQYQTYALRDFGGGEDQQSAESNIQEGYVEEFLNCVPKAEGYFAKRTGYQGYCGYMPIRATALSYSSSATDNIGITLDASISLTSIRSHPLLVQGKTSSTNSANVGDFPNDATTTKYYDSFTVDVKKTFSTGSSSQVLPQTEHGVTTPYQFVGTSLSSSLTSNNNEIFLADSVSINQSTNATTVSVNNGTGSAFDGFIYVKNKAAVSGNVYVTSPIAFATGTNTTSITAATHGLNNFNILAKCYIDNGTTYEEIIPDSVTITTAGTVSVTVVNGGSSINVVIILSSTALANTVVGSAAASASLTATITDITTPFLFVSCYIEQTVGGTLEMVLPDSITVNEAAGTAEVVFQNSNIASTNFVVYYEYGDVTSNQLFISGSTISGGDAFADESPQITVWGLNHDNIYASSNNKEGWVTHIDAYRALAENKVIAGLGGNLFEASTDTTTLLMPTLYPNIRNRVESETVIGPAFWNSAETSSRTAGYISAASINSNWASVSSFTYDSGTGYVKVTLDIPGMVLSSTLSSIINTTAGMEDSLTIRSAEYARYSGTFTIKQVIQVDGNTLDIYISGTGTASSDWDTTDSGAQAAIFTDRVGVLDSIVGSDTASFIEGDVLSSDAFPTSLAVTASRTSGNTLVMAGLVEEVDLPEGLRITGERTSAVLPLRDLDGTASVTNLIPGDMLSLTSYSRLLRVTNINPNEDISCTLTGDGETATLTLLSGSADSFSIGDKLLLLQAGNYSGDIQVTSITSSTTLTFASTATASTTAILRGKTVGLDESLLLTDNPNSSVTASVGRRWSPIEAPEDSFTNTKKTYKQHFDVQSPSTQSYLRSTMVADSLFFTNGEDEVMKYDGTNIYRAGLPRWQPHLFVTTDTNPASGGEIETTSVAANITSASTNKYTIPLGSESQFTPGDTVIDSNNGAKYIVVATGRNETTSGEEGYVYVNSTISGSSYSSGSDTLSLVSVYSYYFRLNAVDANNNIIASAVTGSQDFRVELGEDAQVRLRLVGFPPLDNYDYDRLEVELYRTASNSRSIFYRLASVPLDFNNSDGYIDYVDTASDDTLRDLDIVSSSLLQEELGTQFSQPLRAKYITSAGNRLILGNIKQYPKIDIKLVDVGARITPSVLSGDIYTFRKDNTSTSTTTNMTDVINYEFVTSGAVTIDPTRDITNNSGTSFTITVTGHNLAVGDWVYFFHDAVADGHETQYCGWFQVSAVPNANNFTCLHEHPSGYTPGADDVTRYVKATAEADVPVWLGTDGNYSMLNGNRSTSDAYEFLAMRRLANAINASMRMTNTSISGQESFVPWMIANAGNEYESGQLVVEQPKVFSTTMEVVLPSFSGFLTFVNSISRSAQAQVSAIEIVNPSRVLASFPNYPEIFNAPGVVLDSDSANVFDANPADGQQLTGILPFFGSSAYGGAQQASVVVAFKENSIHLIDLTGATLTTARVQRIESQGLGCTAPYSLTTTRDGIMFANEAGIYRLNKGLGVDYVGRKKERFWKTGINKQQLSLMSGHHYASGSEYKLSIPLVGESVPSRALVYNHTREQQGKPGSWTTFSNHPATGWANLEDDAFMATTRGQVFSLRSTGGNSDYRDDASAISMDAILRALDFGDGGIRKSIGSILVHFRVLTNTVGTKLFSAVNLGTSFEEADAFQIVDPTTNLTGIGDTARIKMKTIKFSIDKRKGVYLQLRLTNGTIDEPVEVAGIDIRVAGLSSEGITEAGSTT